MHDVTCDLIPLAVLKRQTITAVRTMIPSVACDLIPLAVLKRQTITAVRTMIPSVACDLIPSRNEVYPLDMNPKKAIRQLKRVGESLFLYRDVLFHSLFFIA